MVRRSKKKKSILQGENMKDNKDGTVSYSQEEIDSINNFLDKIFNLISDYMDDKEKE